MKKKLENLYSWQEFYSKNNQWSQYHKVTEQIERLKNG